MGFILKYVIVIGLLYLAYRKLDKSFVSVESFSANVVGKFTKKNGTTSEGDASDILDVKDVWKHFIVLVDEDTLPIETDDVVEDLPDAKIEKMTEEVSDELYNQLEIGDSVLVKISYSRWTKKIIKTDIVKTIEEEDLV